MLSFASARIKLSRAIHHFEALKTEVQAIEKTNLPELIREYDSNTRQNLWRWQGISEDTSTKLGPIIGDILTNSFACLDHIMYAFLGGSIPDKTIYWPVSVSTNAWKSAKGRYKGLPSLALDIIEDYQPSERPNNYESSLMSVLHKLVNIDKHRRLVVVNWPVQGVGTSREFVDEITFNLSDAAKSGAIFASLNGDKVDVKLYPTLYIGFDEAGWLRRKNILQIFRDVVSMVQKILERFEGQFN